MLTCGNENPAATAKIEGSKKYNSIRGRVDFYDTYEGTVVIARIWGIPEEFGDGFFGFHIHEGGFALEITKIPSLRPDIITIRIINLIRNTQGIFRRCLEIRARHGRQFIRTGFIRKI